MPLQVLVSVPQSRPPSLTTVPLVRRVIASDWLLRVKVAVTDWFVTTTERLGPEAMKVQFPVGWLLHTSPVQPRNVVPVVGVGTSVTLVPVKISSKQLVPHAMPGPLTVPVPLPAVSTLTPVMPRKSAVLLVLALTTKSQVACVRPPHGPPDQLRKRLPGCGVAWNTMRVPCGTSRAQIPALPGGQSRPLPPTLPTVPCPRAPAGVATATRTPKCLTDPVTS